MSMLGKKVMRSKDAFKAVFGDDSKKETYKMVGHSFNKTISGKSVCSNCGLIVLNNEFTRWCIEKGCYADLHPQYNSVKVRLTRLL